MATQNTPFRLDDFTRAALEYLAEEANTTMTDVVKNLVEREAVKTIAFTVYAPDLFYNWAEDTDNIDERASAWRYAKLWEQAVEAAYPTAAVDWNIDWLIGSAGDIYGIQVNGWTGHSGTVLVDMVAQHVAEIGDAVYQNYEWVVDAEAKVS